MFKFSMSITILDIEIKVKEKNFSVCLKNEKKNFDQFFLRICVVLIFGKSFLLRVEKEENFFGVRDYEYNVKSLFFIYF